MKTALCKLRGMLVLMEIQPTEQQGKCPDCGGTKFVNGTSWDKGWVNCTNCDFAVLAKHLERRRKY